MLYGATVIVFVPGFGTDAPVTEIVVVPEIAGLKYSSAPFDVPGMLLIKLAGKQCGSLWNVPPLLLVGVNGCGETGGATV